MRLPLQYVNGKGKREEGKEKLSGGRRTNGGGGRVIMKRAKWDKTAPERTKWGKAVREAPY